MYDVERHVWREARVMIPRDVITNQLSWVQAAKILGVTPAICWRIRRMLEQHELEAV